MSLLSSSTPPQQLHLSKLFFLTPSSTDGSTPLDTSICRELLKLYILVCCDPILISSISLDLSSPVHLSNHSLSLQTYFPSVFQFFSPSLFDMLVVSMAPKRKSTMSQNPLCFGVSSSSNPTPSHLQFCDEDARKDFLENFSRRSVHSECRVILVDFADTNLPIVFHSRGWESLCNVLVTCPSVLI